MNRSSALPWMACLSSPAIVVIWIESLFLALSLSMDMADSWAEGRGIQHRLRFLQLLDNRKLTQEQLCIAHYHCLKVLKNFKNSIHFKFDQKNKQTETQADSMFIVFDTTTGNNTSPGCHNTCQDVVQQAVGAGTNNNK